MAQRKPNARHQARMLALQALYQWQLAKTDAEAIRTQFYASQSMRQVDQAYFDLLLKGVIQSVIELNNLITPFLDRDLSTLDPIELTILRLSAYEFKYCPDVPYKVVINEALELAKSFGATDSYKYVNGVLDRLGRQLRSAEITG